MNKRKLRDEIAARNKQRVFELLKEFPDGLLSSEIVKVTGLELKCVTKLLISLRTSQDIVSIVVDTYGRIHRWKINTAPKVFTPHPAFISRVKPEPEVTVVKKKPLYNPCGPSYNE
jgi:hypothetical protein